MNTYRERLLRLAARSAGLQVHGVVNYTTTFSGLVTDKHDKWDPLTDSGQALDLAIELGLTIEGDAEYEGQVEVFDYDRTFVRIETFGPDDNDKFTATRSAIVRAAARTGGEEV